MAIQCPVPSCPGQIVNKKCVRCGAFSYVGGGSTGAGGPTPPSPPGRRAPHVPPRLMTCEQWKLLTCVSLKPRSVRLKAIDWELDRYETDRSERSLKRVQKAFGQWEQSKGGQQGALRSRRNRKHAVELLGRQLKGEAVTVPGALPEFMEAGMENARLGVLYLFGNTEVKSDVFSVALQGGLSIAGDGFKLAGELAPGGTMEGMQAAKVTGEQLLNMGQRGGLSVNVQDHATLTNALQTLVKKMLTGMGEVMQGIDVNSLATSVIGMVKGLIKTLADFFLKSAAPFISGGMDIVKGVAKAVVAAADLLKTWWIGRGVNLMPGHPTFIVDALKGAMRRSLFEGLYDTLKGATSTVLDVVGAATGGVAEVAFKIAGIVWSVVEALAKVVIRVVETLGIKRFCAKAREQWQARGDAHALHKNPTAFHRWYRAYSIHLPAIAALTLNSRLCGDKLRFLKLYEDDQSFTEQVVLQKRFNQGVRFIDSHLKPFAAGLLQECGFSFSSGDPIVTNAIKFAQRIEQKSFSGKTGDFVLKVLTT